VQPYRHFQNNTTTHTHKPPTQPPVSHQQYLRFVTSPSNRIPTKRGRNLHQQTFLESSSGRIDSAGCWQHELRPYESMPIHI
jgi:hypothetical protein